MKAKNEERRHYLRSSQEIYNIKQKYVTGKGADQLIEDLHGFMFQNPVGNPGPYENWQTADEYLSGNVREKLETAKSAVDVISDKYAVNVQALEEVLPKDLEPHEIDVRLGSAWLPPSDVDAFMYELLNTNRYMKSSIHAQYCPQTSGWNITCKSLDAGNVRARSQYGTSRANAYKILEEWLRQQDPQTGITKNAFRTMVVSGQIPSLKVGSKYLLNVDKMIPFLYQEGNREKLK